MAQISVTTAPGQVEAIRADGCGVESDVRDSAIRSGYKIVRSATSALAASMSAEDQAEDQMVPSCPEASPMKWHQAYTTWFFEDVGDLEAPRRPELAGCQTEPLRQDK